MVEDKWSKSLSFSSELSLCLLKYESDIVFSVLLFSVDHNLTKHEE